MNPTKSIKIRYCKAIDPNYYTVIVSGYTSVCYTSGNTTTLGGNPGYIWAPYIPMTSTGATIISEYESLQYRRERKLKEREKKINRIFHYDEK